MKILRNTRRAFSLLGFLSDEPIFASKHVHTIASLIFIFDLLLEEVTSITYMVKHMLIGDYQNALFASLQIPSVLPAIVILFTMLYRRDKVRSIILELQRLVDNCNCRGLR